MIEPNNIYHGDCMELLPLIPDASVDMVLCDLPYGQVNCKWDSLLPSGLLWEHYKRIIKPNGVIALFAVHLFSARLMLSNEEWFRYEWIWEKEQGTNFYCANLQPLKVHENILIFSPLSATPHQDKTKERARYFPQKEQGKPYMVRKKGKKEKSEIFHSVTNRLDTVNSGNRYPKSVIKFNRERGLHPTQKPVTLCEYLIKTYTQPGEIVLDNCLGSGTTAIACINTHRQYIGIEKEEQYFNIALERIKQAQGAYVQHTIEGMSA